MEVSSSAAACGRRFGWRCGWRCEFGCCSLRRRAGHGTTVPHSELERGRQGRAAPPLSALRRHAAAPTSHGRDALPGRSSVAGVAQARRPRLARAEDRDLRLEVLLQLLVEPRADDCLNRDDPLAHAVLATINSREGALACDATRGGGALAGLCGRSRRRPAPRGSRGAPSVLERSYGPTRLKTPRCDSMAPVGLAASRGKRSKAQPVRWTAVCNATSLDNDLQPELDRNLTNFLVPFFVARPRTPPPLRAACRRFVSLQ